MRKTEAFKPKPFVPIRRRVRDGYLAASDGLLFLQGLRDGIADIIFLDPPFNLGKDYGVASDVERLPREDYESYMRGVLKESARVIRPGGALFMYHIPFWAAEFGVYLNGLLRFRHWIAIMMKNGFVRGENLYPAHYALLYYTKGSPSHFSRPKITPLTCRACGETVRDYGGYRKYIEEKGGVNLSDVWEDVSPVRHGNRKLRRANQLPTKITDRVIAIAGVAGGLLIDPFMGTGTALVSAREMGMSFIGNDLDGDMVSVVAERLSTTSFEVTPVES